MLPQTIKVVDDNLIEKVKIEGKTFHIFDFNPDKKFEREIIVTPHKGENYGNTGFWKLKLYCERNNIKLISFGTLNQFPLFSTFSDKVILYDGVKLDKIYVDGSMLRQPQVQYKKLTDAEFVEINVIDGNTHNELMNLPSDRVFNKRNLVVYNKFPFYGNALLDVSDKDAAEAFVNRDVYIRKSSLDLFHSLSLPTNQIVCEFKVLSYGKGLQVPYLLPIYEWTWLNKEKLRYPVVGIDREFQRDLLGNAGHHYMSIQVLSSFISNWFYLCLGGSSNLMSILPIKALILTDKFINFNNSAVDTLRHWGIGRYGEELGQKIPVLRPTMMLTRKKLDMVAAINEAIDEISKQEVNLVSF